MDEPRCRVCDGPYYARGLCEKHYARWRRYGNPEAPTPQRGPAWNRSPDPVCSVDGCDSPTRGHGFCNKHYKRWKRWGDPERTNYARGADVWSWKGDDAAYESVHDRVRRWRGPASAQACVDCGEPADHWSYQRGCASERTSPEGYPFCPHDDCFRPRCLRCHHVYDNRVANLH